MAMLFEIFMGGERKFATDRKECIPDNEQLKQMAKLGYKFKKEGKAWKPPSTRTKSN